MNLIETYFQWPVGPFSIMLCLVSAYWLLVILGGMDLDTFDFDLDIDLDADVDTSVTDLGMLGLKWLNLGEVPFMLWTSAVVLFSWIVAMVFDRNLGNLTTQESIALILRNLGIGIVATKIVTNPLRGKFKMKEPNTVAEMIGRQVSVVTSEVNTEFGNAICHVEDGAPLRLNVRTLEGSIPKESLAQIIDYSSETGIYYVKEVN